MVTSLALLVFGCTFQEDLPEQDIRGTLIIPRAAATRTIATGEEVIDPRLIGPVYLGAFSGMDNVSFGYPHPSMGPIVTSDTPGDTFPYGGTTVGRFDFACYEALTCKVVTGRFTDYADILDYFGVSLGSPVRDENGEAVVNPSTFQQACYDYFYATSDAEMSFIGTPDFEENADGDFEASFLMAHTLLVDGMAIWGWMDAPEIVAGNTNQSGSYSTCDSNGGREYTAYNQNFYEGRVYYDALNAPSTYIYSGDWVGSGDGDAVVTVAEDGSYNEPTVRLDFGFDIEEVAE